MSISEKIAKYVTAASDAFEAGFNSKAAKTRALDAVNRAYDTLRGDVCNDILSVRNNAEGGPDGAAGEALTALYYAIPFDLHNVREEKHVGPALAAGFAAFAQVRDFVALRKAIKDAEIVAVVSADRVMADRAETVRRSVVEEIERRRAIYVEGLEVARHFKGLPVYVNAHMVRNQFGTVFVRHFFYLPGVLTPLQTIIAIADTYAREQEAAAA